MNKKIHFYFTTKLMEKTFQMFPTFERLNQTIKAAFIVLFLALPLSAQNVFVWDGDFTNLSGISWYTYFLNQGGYNATYNSTLPSDFSAYDAIFLSFGIYSNNHSVTTIEATNILNYANAGGKIYIEGGDIFGFDPGKTQIQQLCGLSGASDGSAMAVNDSTPLSGQVGTLTTGMNFYGYTGQNSYIDSLSPGNATSIFKTADNITRAVQYDNGVYQVVGMSFELGGLVDTTGVSKKDSLMTAIVHFLGINPIPAVPQNLTATPGNTQANIKVEYEYRS